MYVRVLFESTSRPCFVPLTSPLWALVHTFYFACCRRGSKKVDPFLRKPTLFCPNRGRGIRSTTKPAGIFYDSPLSVNGAWYMIWCTLFLRISLTRCFHLAQAEFFRRRRTQLKDAARVHRHRRSLRLESSVDLCTCKKCRQQTNIDISFRGSFLSQDSHLCDYCTRREPRHIMDRWVRSWTFQCFLASPMLASILDLCVRDETANRLLEFVLQIVSTSSRFGSPRALSFNPCKQTRPRETDQKKLY